MNISNPYRDHQEGLCKDNCIYCREESRELQSRADHKQVSNPCSHCNQPIQPHLLKANQQFCLDCFHSCVLKPLTQQIFQLRVKESELTQKLEELSSLLTPELDPKRFYTSQFWHCQTPGCGFVTEDFVQREHHGHSSVRTWCIGNKTLLLCSN